MANQPGSTTPIGIATGPHLCPLLLFHSTEKNYTPFNFVPLAAALNAERLLILSSVPFHSYRFYGGEYNDSGITYPLDIRFLADSDSVDNGPRVTARPVVVWSEQPNLVELLKQLHALHPAFILVVTAALELPEEVAALVTSEKLMSWVSVHGGSDRRFHVESSLRIWSAYLELIQTLFRLANGDGEEGTGNRMAPELKTPVTLARQLVAAKRGSSSPWMEKLKADVIPWDFVVAPNAIVLNHMTFKLSIWSEKVFSPEAAHAVSLQYARRILAARGLSNYLMYSCQAKDESRFSEILEEFEKRIPRSYRPLLKAAVRDRLTEDETIARYSELFEKVPDQLGRLAPHQIILICPSATLAMERAKTSFGRRGLTMIDHGQAQKDPDYFAEMQKAASGPGRVIQLRAPETPAQEEIMLSMQRGVTLEAQFLSAIGVIFSTRFSCPVLKLTRSGSEVFDPFLLAHDEFLKLESDHTKVAAAIRALSKHTAVLFPKDYLSYIVSERYSLLHSFGDYPLEFTNAGHDYLGFKSQLSRTPITPGYISLINYNLTEHTIPMPTSLDECVLVTPFPEDDDVTSSIRDTLALDGTELATTVINDKEALKAKLRDEKIRCLIYIGHGYHNAQFDESALVLPTGHFRESDLEGIGRVPPLIVLVGCTTAPSVSIFSGMHQAFLRSGALVVVGTSFQVPKIIGVQFLTTFVQFLIGSKRPHPRDISELVTLVRHEIRVDAVLYSLVELGRITWAQMGEIQDEHKSRIEMLPPPSAGTAHKISLQVLAKILAGRNVIPKEGTAPVDWGIIPYPLFFSTFGFPWTTRSKRWENAAGGLK